MKVVCLRLCVGIWASCMHVRMQITCTHVPACVCVPLGVCACTCMWYAPEYTGSRLQARKHRSFFTPHLYLLYNQFANAHLTHLTEGHELVGYWSEVSRVLCWADRLLHTYNSSTLHSGSLSSPSSFFSCSLTSLLSFPPTPPCCAALPLPLLLCFKSSSFPLSIISSIPPLFPSSRSPTFSLPLSEWVAGVSSRCKAVWEVVVKTAWQAACLCAQFLFVCLFLLSVSVSVCPLWLVWRMVERQTTEMALVIEPWLCLMKL